MYRELPLNLGLFYACHEAISRMFDERMTVPQAAAISGHKTISMLFRYAHTLR